MESPPIKIAFCECCLEKRERREFVGRVVRPKKDKPVHFRVCQSCNSYEDEDDDPEDMGLVSRIHRAWGSAIAEACHLIQALETEDVVTDIDVEKGKAKNITKEVKDE